ncbi:MAG: 1-phosphofructokinase family hexose kinase [Candidatus Methylomirabilales bacterium]
MQRIVTVTMNASIDKSCTIDRVVPERKLRCNPPCYEPGGGGINVSRAIRKLGGESLALYPSGGPTGQMLQELLDQEGLNHRAIPSEGWTRVNLTVLEESTGQQFRFVMPGPTLRHSEWQRCLDELAAVAPQPDYVVASGSLPPGVPDDFFARVVRIANDLGARSIVDTSGEALRVAAREGVYLLKPNLRELSQLAGRALDDEPNQEAAAIEMIEAGGCETVAVSLGGAGVLLVSRQEHERLRSPTVPIVSKVGAGDSMVAGIVLSLARGESLRNAVRFGVAAGAAAVMTPGAELCRREDTERLYKRMIAGTSRPRV